MQIAARGHRTAETATQTGKRLARRCVYATGTVRRIHVVKTVQLLSEEPHDLIANFPSYLMGVALRPGIKFVFRLLSKYDVEYG